MSEEPGLAGVVAEQRELLSRLRAVVEAKDAENAVLRRELDAERELRRRLELKVAELERRLGMDSSDSGTPSSKERIGAKEARRARQESERERRKDRKRGGQPGHEGKGLARDPDPGGKKAADPPAQCRRCKAGLHGAEAVAEPGWAQVTDVEVIRKVTEWALPGLVCPCCGTVTFADPPPGAYAGAVSYGAVLNAAAVLLACYGNVPAERAARQHALDRLFDDPLGVPAGTLTDTLCPDRVGTRTVAPSAASANVTGRSTRRSSPSRTNTGCGATATVRMRSPRGAPGPPGEPLPRSRIRWPSRTPAGIRVVMF